MVGQRARNRHSLLLSARHLRGAVRSRFAEADICQQLRALARLSSRGTFASAIEARRSRARKESASGRNAERRNPMLCSLNDVASQSLMSSTRFAPISTVPDVG